MDTGFEQVVENLGRGVELLGVGVMVGGMAVVLVRYARHVARPDSYRTLRRGLGRSVIVGLEVLVAGDLIRTVVVAPTYSAVGRLGAIIVVRAFLSLVLEVEAEGRLPWHRHRAERDATGAGSGAVLARLGAAAPPAPRTPLRPRSGERTPQPRR